VFFGKGDLATWRRGTSREWLVTNGSGGYAAGTLVLANTRKYHGLLVAALDPPGDRWLLLAKLDEYLESDSTGYNLAANEVDGRLWESGFVHLQSVQVDPLPLFVYSMADIRLEKRVTMARGQNTTVVSYRVFCGGAGATLYLKPLVNCRGYHHLTRRGQVDFGAGLVPGGVEIRGAAQVPPLVLTATRGEFLPEPDWYYGLSYAVERERGEPDREDHFRPGQFRVECPAGEETVFHVTATVENGPWPDPALVYPAERERLAGLVSRPGLSGGFVSRLVTAADAFVVNRRSTATLVAGYPWFTDWGRDAMVSLPGLTLVTGRFTAAREILGTFARQVKDGLVPNAFFDTGPVYNTVDASLWYFYAVDRYLAYTGDLAFVREEIYPVLGDIFRHYREGTSFGIGMDEDGLIRAGQPGVQLTWMDAKAGDWVVTPRRGRPVEVQALWYNALKVLEGLAAAFGEVSDAGILAGRVRENFRRLFWNPAAGCFYDYLGQDGPDASLRPNQVLALSLPFAVAEGENRVLARVFRSLYTSYGLRSLSPEDSRYRGRYLGDQVQRDGAYHQGTVWSWLIGPFVTAWRKTHGYSPESRDQAMRLLAPFGQHLNDHGVGYISEIFDGDEPLVPRGCFAQAWGVAEVLRAWVEEVLEKRPPWEEKYRRGALK
jgi:predicted glycogen debranching enzyme